ncbi:thiamine biosynthesis protein ThiF (plasmid) [Sinorhizobium americanum]|uniref:Thiamine biosynthesis protein ThiF n=2 Tax=Sinorhizobium americanum TaxID=194963 RepID=A0A1L3LTA1_9HYPH|nr:ThiF family adenylyltransferase [Sinorhizobium americanum]APG93321.1 thiamine biosynthesis protein ThiF [Sinorhizobium americanum]
MPRILKELKAEHYDVTDGDVHDFVSALAGFGLIEESSRFSSLLSSEEIERYDRQMLQFSLIDEDRVDNATAYQERLKQARVLVLGMGGWGTWCSLLLARSGIGTLRIVDGDDVELSNLNRQVLYNTTDLGARKVDAAAANVRKHNPHVRVEPFYEFALPDRVRLGELLKGVTVAILAWASLGYYRKDSVERIVHEIARDRQIPVIELGGDPLDISVGPIYLNDGSHPSFEDLRRISQDRFYSDDALVRSFQEARLKNEFANGNRSVNAWQSSPSLAVMAGLAADQVLKLITKYDNCNLVGKRFHMSLRTYATREEVLFEQD